MPCSESTASGFSFDTFCGLMMTRSVGSNGVLVRVGARGLADGRLVGKGVAVGVGKGVELGKVGAGLAVESGEGVVFCAPGGIGIVSLASLQARLGIMAPKRKAMMSMRFFFMIPYFDFPTILVAKITTKCQSCFAKDRIFIEREHPVGVISKYQEKSPPGCSVIVFSIYRLLPKSRIFWGLKTKR